MSVRIERCVCYQKSFKLLKEVADATGSITVAELQEHVEFGKGCRLCHPYVRKMLETGETVFHEIIEDDA